MRNHIQVTPQDAARIGTIGEALSTGWAKIPTYYYFVQQYRLPLTNAEFNGIFTGSQRLFTVAPQPQNCPGLQTNADIGSGVNECFLAFGAGVVAIGEDLSFCQPGSVLDRASLPGSVAPAIAECVDVEGVAGGLRPGVLWYGGPTWRFINKFFNAKRFVLRVASRFELVNESLFDVGMVPAPPEFVGAGDSCVPTMPFIRDTNDVMREKDLPNVFLPPNQDVGGSCVPAPNAPVTYGHPRITGLSNRLYCFNQPILFTPGMRFDMEFQTVENDCCFSPAAFRAAVADCLTPDEGVPETTENLLSAEACTIPGGCISLGVVLKGFALWPQAVADYLANYMTCGSAYEAMYMNNSYVAGVIQKFGLAGHDNLKGLVAGTAGIRGE